MIWKKFIFFLVGFIILIIFTPQLLSDSIYGMKFGSMKFTYMDQNKRLISFTFDHKNYDSKLMVYSIQKELVKYKIKKNINIYNFKPYQYLNNKRILKYSRFTSSVSYLLDEMIKHQKRKIKVCIIVSIRDKINDNTRKGNFIKFAYYTLVSSDNIIDICSKHHKAVIKTQSKQHIKNNTTFYDFFCSFNNVDYVFNSWRDLSSINTKSNGLLIRQSTTNIIKKDIYNLKYKKNRSFITLDFFDDKYIISNINHF